jgi:hypothetical protein
MYHRSSRVATMPWHSVRDLGCMVALTVLTLTLLQNAALAQSQPATVSLATTPLEVTNGAAKLVGHYDPNQKLRLVIGLQIRNSAELDQLLLDLHDKESPQYHQWLTPAQYAQRFGPLAVDEQQVVNWAQSQGLTITARYPNRLIVDLEGPAGTIEQAFGVTINQYSVNSKTYFSNDRDPAIPVNLKNIVQSVGGLNNLQVLHPASKSVKQATMLDYSAGPVVANGPNGSQNGDRAKLAAAIKARKAQQAKGLVSPITGGAYDPTDLYSSEAYDTNALYAEGHCCNPFHVAGGTPKETSIAIATAGSQDGNDFLGFHNQYPYLAEHWFMVFVDGSPACCDGEGTLDFEWSTAMSNSFGSFADTSSVVMYDGINPNFSTFIDVYNRILSDNTTRIFSTSWGCEELNCWGSSNMNTAHNIFSAMSAQGWTLVAATGDQGATASCLAADGVQYPASDPNIVGAGGTTLRLDSSSNFVSETAWTGGPDGCSSNDGGSTGGCSSFWSAPSYQGTAACPGNMRSVPDLALNADWFNTPQNIFFGGGLSGNGGTSIVAPELAGFFANSNAYLLSLGNICGLGLGTQPCAPMGNANIFIYNEGLGPNSPHYPYYDVLSGCNNNDITATFGLGFYCAGPGYDRVTGWGSINMLQMAWTINWRNVAESGAPFVTFSGPAINHWFNVDQSISWTVTDTGSGSFAASGVSGHSWLWDSDPGDVTSEATPGFGNSFYSGPFFPNSTTGSSTLSAIGQGCHTMNVRGWDNMGVGSGDSTYGPVCYDVSPPVTSASLSGTQSGGVFITPVKVTLSATDSFSGVAGTVYQINGGAVTNYVAPFTISTRGSYTIAFHSTDVAGNVEGTKSVSFVYKAPTTTTLTTSLNPSRSGQAVTFTAKVTSGVAGTITNTISFKDGAGTLSTVAVNASGVATYTTSTLASAVHPITAVYNGNATYAPSTSLVVNQTVAGKAAVALASSLNPSTYGKVVSFTATVSATPGPVPTGTVTFKDVTKGLTLGTKTLAGGKAIFATTATQLVPGSHVINATYNGDTLHAAGAVKSLTQTVNKAASTTALSALANPSTYGKPVTFTAKITSGVAGTITGTVSFKNGATLLATVAVNSSGVATYTTTATALVAGAHTISATYNGDTLHLTSTHSITETVNKAATTTHVTSSLNPSTFGKSVTFTAKVTSTASGAFTGTATFKNGGVTMGTGIVGSGGTATFSTSTLAVGSHSITVTYGGNANFLTSTSPALTQVVH